MIHWFGLAPAHRGVDAQVVAHAGAQALQGRPVFEPSRAPGSNPGFAISPPFRYPPAAAYLLGAPLSLMPRGSAADSWSIVQEACLLVDCVVVAAVCTRPIPLLISLAAWLWLPAVFMDLWLGQFSLVTASLVFWSAILWRIHWDSREPLPRAARQLGALLWGASVLIKGMPLLYGLCFYKEARTRRSVVCVVGLLALTTGAYFAIFPRDFLNFAWVNLDHSAARTSTQNVGLWNVLATGLREQPSGLREACGIGLAASVILVMLAANFRTRRESLLWLFGGWTCAFILTFKEVWEHHYLFLAPFVCLLCARACKLRPASLAQSAPAHRLEVLAFLILLWLLVPAPGVSELLGGANLALMWRPLPALLLFAVCLAASWRARDVLKPNGS